MNKIIFIGLLMALLASCTDSEKSNDSGKSNGADNNGVDNNGGSNDDMEECISGGSGDSIEDPIVICTYDDLNRMRENLDESGEIDKHYALGAGIDATPSWSAGSEGCAAYDGESIASENPCSGWVPLPRLNSSFDGRNHIISNLYISRGSDSVGFFENGHISSSVKNLHLRNARINNTKSTTPSATAGITGGSDNPYSIRHCSVTGKITALVGSAGGIVGQGGLIFNSYADVVVEGQFAGGLMGSSGTSGRIYSSYARGSATAMGSYSFAGGIAGNLDEGAGIRNSYADVAVSGSHGVAALSGGTTSPRAHFHNSYAVGLVTYTGANEASDPIGGLLGRAHASDITISNSFWDTESTGQDSSAGTETGLTTSQIQVACSGVSTGICALGEGFVFTAGSYPKVKKCLSACDTDSPTFSNELLEGQD